MDCLAQHVGGTKFFEAIDERFKNKNIIEALLKHAALIAHGHTTYEGSNRAQLVMSGKFGLFINNLLAMDDVDKQIPFNHFVVNGGLREKNPIVQVLDNTHRNFDDMFNGGFVFVDDSFYSNANIMVAVKAKHGYTYDLFMVEHESFINMALNQRIFKQEK